MRDSGISACIIPSTDPYLSEYPADHWKAREWLSGFDGSAATLVVTNDKAGLWTDSRYYLQAENQLKNTGITLYKDGLPETPSFMQWLTDNLTENSRIAADGRCVSVEQWREWSLSVAEAWRANTPFGCAQGTDDRLIDIDLISEIWTDRPPLSQDAPFHFDIKYAGKSSEEKIADLQAEMRRQKADVCLVTALDDIAWLLNMRPAPPSPPKEGLPNGMLIGASSSPPLGGRGGVCLLDISKTNYSLYNKVSEKYRIIEAVSPVSLAKSIKNETEIAGFRRAMTRDGVAMVRFLKWLEGAMEDKDGLRLRSASENRSLSEAEGSNEKITELSLAKQLTKFRTEARLLSEAETLFFSESFPTIAGYGANGAIVHYSATKESDTILENKGFLLLDSGGHYLDGTTDITRTIPLGRLTTQQKRDFTLVLKGHIALATVRFPEGTQGIQLDVLARQFLWQNDLNYGHGTGHGVGHFLNVHESPPAIGPRRMGGELKAGMVISNEPGVYHTGEYGIRIENLMLVTEAPSNSPSGERTACASCATENSSVRQVPLEGGFRGAAFLQFETLTLCPIDKRAINFDLLTKEEKDWLNDYHKMVLERLNPHLNTEESDWLREKCIEII
jgi:Xaa-Pro aminopeptidase